MTPESLDADATALAGAGSVAEEALALHRDARAVLNEGWNSQSSCAAKALIDRQCGEAADLVDALHSAAAELRLLRDAIADPGAGADSAHDVAAARLGDRPAPQFAAPAAAPQQTPAPAFEQTPQQQKPTWPAGISLPTLPQLPNLGAALVGMAAQIADAIGPVAADPVPPDAPAHEPRPAPEAPPVHQSRPALAASETSRPATEVGAKPAAPGQPAPAPLSPPLLAAEQPPVLIAPPGQPPPGQPPPEQPPEQPPTGQPPPEQSPPEPAAAAVVDPSPPAPPRSPCEIAADELPHVG